MPSSHACRKHAELRLGSRATLLRCGLLSALLASTATRPAAGQDEVRSYSIHDTRSAAAIWNAAEDHIAAARWGEAIDGLQTLIEEHQSAVLADSADGTSKSGAATHFRGATRRAAARLSSLPGLARTLYEDRYGPRARRTLDAARESGARGALAEVARRWPISSAAEDALWSLGDLEWEQGNLTAARLAWGRALVRATGGTPGTVPGSAPDRATGSSSDPWQVALSIYEARSPERAAGARRRLELTRAAAASSDESGGGDPQTDGSSRSDGSFRSGGSFRLAGSSAGVAEGADPAPGRDSGGWSEPFVLPAHPFKNTGGGQLYPVLAGDTLLVSTSLQLIAIDALTGRRRWDSGLAPGWDALSGDRLKEFFDGIDQGSALIAPATGSGVAVAALQIPVSAVRKSTYGDSDIVRVLPDRRLFAYDLESGRALWNHRPPPLWDGEGGSFTERMRACGSPVIAADRVLVPMCRYQGRIDFHLACFDLRSGARLWSVPLITGQRELNMFGRPTQEFSAPPVRVDGDLVCVATQLGSLAAVDLFSGELLWEFLYDQIPLPQTHGWTPVWRREVWLNAPPVSSAGVLLATPADSRKLVAVELLSGRHLWSLDHKNLESMLVAGSNSRSRLQALDVLLGADRDTVYLGGRMVAALATSPQGEPGGLADGPPTEARWVIEENDDNHKRPRALLARETVLIPSYDRRLEVDRQTGLRRDHPITWGTAPGGNVLLSGGALYHLTPKQLSASFEWRTLLTRAEAATHAAPESQDAARDLATLQLERGRTLWRADKPQAAEPWLERARNTLSPLARGEDHVADVALLADLQRILRVSARLRSELGDGGAAQALLTQARALAAEPRLFAEQPELLRDTLVELLFTGSGAPVIGLGTDHAPRLALLDELERATPHLPLPCRFPSVAVDLGGTGAPAAPSGAPAAPWDLRPRLADLEGASATADGRNPLAAPPVELETAAWVRLARARLAAQAADWDQLLADLHGLLRDYSDAIPGPRGTAPLGDWAGARIGQAISSGAPGAEAAHAPYQQQAAAALEAARTSRRRSALSDLRHFYPHTMAAEEAQRELLNWALESGDLQQAVAVILGALPPDYSPATPSPLQREQFQALAELLGDTGNGPLRSAWLASLDGEKLSAAETSPPSHAGVLDQQPAVQESQRGSWEDLGHLPGSAQSGARLLASNQELVLWDSSGQRAWSLDFGISERPPSWRGRLSFGAGRLHLATTKRLLTITAATGELLWSEQFESYITGLSLASGVLVCGLRGGDRATRFAAFDAHGGLPLWERTLPASGFANEPLSGPRQVLILPRNPGQLALSLDLFTGGTSAEIHTGPVLGSSRAAAWIEGQRLFLPNFLEGNRPERNNIRAFDLKTGEQAWEKRFGDDGDGRELHAILSQGSAHFLLLRSRGQRPAQTSSRRPTSGDADAGQQTAPGILLQLDTGIGATARVGRLEIQDDEQPVGVGKGRHIQLEAPYLFLRSSPPGRAELSLRAVHLPYGVRWTARVPLRLGELYTRSMPEPVIFDNAVALCWTEWPRQTLRPRAHTFLAVLERSTGRGLWQLELDSDLGTSEYLDLIGNNGTLLLSGRDSLEVMR